jgi:glycosyltransferase involved in cell wall biosynthesis
MSKSRITLHQVTDSAVPGDAITDQALTLQRWLRELGYKSDIYSLHCAESLATQIKPLNQYKPGRNERFLIYHHGVGSDVVNMLVDIGVPLILFYHNITPPEFYANVDPALANELIHGRSQLQTIRTKAVLGLGASEYSVLELENSGFIKTGILPIAIDESDYNAPSSDVLLDNYRDKRPLLLFVGRLAPNKRQEDLIKLLYYLRRISPGAHLLLVGRIHHKDYHSWLTHLCANLGLKDAVTFTNHVSQEEMVTYYRMADLFVSMSEHEGFGKPLIESMYFEVPVMAYASTAIPSTMGDAGVLFHDKDYEALAEVADLILQDDKLRARLVAGQNRRVADFLETSIKRQLQRIMEDLEYLPEGGANGSRGHRASVSSNHAVSEIKKEANELDLES